MLGIYSGALRFAFVVAAPEHQNHDHRALLSFVNLA
jgi:hypothetical protein